MKPEDLKAAWLRHCEEQFLDDQVAAEELANDEGCRDLFAAGAEWECEDQGFNHLLLTARRLLKHYPKDSLVCSHDVPDVGARFTAALRDFVEEVDRVVRARGEEEKS